MPKGLKGFQKHNKLGYKFRLKEKHWNWKGGRKKTLSGNGKTYYWKIRINNHYIFEHRLIIEKLIKRKLTRKEIVHHKNENGLDNRIENLELMTAKKHNLMHRRLKHRDFICKCGNKRYMAKNLCSKCYGREYSRVKNHWKRKYIKL